jgi:hypothetical protein
MQVPPATLKIAEGIACREDSFVQTKKIASPDLTVRKSFFNEII